MAADFPKDAALRADIADKTGASPSRCDHLCVVDGGHFSIKSLHRFIAAPIMAVIGD